MLVIVICLLFVICDLEFSPKLKVSFSIKLAAFQASGWAEPRTSNPEPDFNSDMPVDAIQPTPHASSDDPQIVRHMALQILRAIDQRGQTLDVTLEDFRQNQPLTRQRDRALLQTLVFGVLRWRGRIDFVIETFSRTPLNKIQPDILNILRMALFQVMFLERIPVSAAVNTAVELAKPLAPLWVVRFVNALLRKAAAGYQKVPFPVLEQNPVAALAASKSFPPWLIRRWLHQFGPDETAALCDAVNTIPPVTLRANTLKIQPEVLLQTLTDEGGTVAGRFDGSGGPPAAPPSKTDREIQRLSEGLVPGPRRSRPTRHDPARPATGGKDSGCLRRSGR